MLLSLYIEKKFYSSYSDLDSNSLRYEMSLCTGMIISLFFNHILASTRDAAYSSS